MEKDDALEIIGQVKGFYDQFAQSFSATRQATWGELVKFVERVKEGERVLDLGCGNGRLLEFLKDKQVDYVGADISNQLLDIARQRYPANQFVLIDGLNLPFPDNSFDWIFSIAVLQHVPSLELRKIFLKETRRVLKPGGKIVLTVWYLWQWKNISGPWLKYTLAKLFKKSTLDFGDIFYQWREAKEVRYLHMFTVGELGRLTRQMGFMIKESGLIKRSDKSQNIYVVATKN